jgi:hypothetical protein
MATKPVTLSIPEEVVTKLANVRNRSGLVTRLLCRHFNLNPDTLEPMDDLQPMSYFIPVDTANLEDDGYVG